VCEIQFLTLEIEIYPPLLRRKRTQEYINLPPILIHANFINDIGIGLNPTAINLGKEKACLMDLVTITAPAGGLWFR
jgi:hypothetical protein